MIVNLLLSTMFVIAGCDMQSTKNEMLNKSEYSIIQSYEYNYRERNNKKPYFIFEHAMNSNLDVLAFPIRGKEKGYVMILAKARYEPKIKSMPEVDFVIRKKDYLKIKALNILSEEVDKFIIEHIN